MRAFTFPLQRVLDLRRRQLDDAQARLHAVLRKQAGVQQVAEQRRQQALQTLDDLASSPELRGADLRLAKNWLLSLEQGRRDALANAQHLDQARGAALGEVMQIRRKVKLLEKLRARKHAAHERGAIRDQEAQAGELHLAHLVR